MKIKILTPYYDKSLGRYIKKEEVIESDEEKNESLKKAGIKFRQGRTKTTTEAPKVKE